MENALKEFKYSIVTYFISLIFNLTLFSGLYWFFNIYKFPATFDRGFCVAAILILLAVTFVIKRKLVSHFDIPSFRKKVITFSSIGCTFMTMLFFLDVISNYGIKTKEISTIENVYTAKSVDLKITNFDVIFKPTVYGKIIEKRQKKRKPLKYAQAYYLYPFKSKKQNVFYCLKFKQKVDRDADEEAQKSAVDNLIKTSQDSVKNYDFRKIKNFEYLTKMSSEYDEFAVAISPEKNAVFLRPITETAAKSSHEKVSTCMILIGIIFIIYIVIFLVTRIIKKDN